MGERRGPFGIRWGDWAFIVGFSALSMAINFVVLTLVQ